MAPERGEYLEGGAVSEISLMTRTPSGGGFFSGQSWRIEPIGEVDTSAEISPTIRITPFGGDGSADLIQRSDDWAGLGTTGTIALKYWRFGRLGLREPPAGCGWRAGDAFYGCEGSGTASDNVPAWECPSGMIVGEPCGNSGLTGVGCCDDDGGNWYFTDANVVLQTSCE